MYAIPMQQKTKKAIQIYLEEDQIKWLDDNKGPELKRGGVIRNLIREKMKETFDQDAFDQSVQTMLEKTEALKQKSIEDREKETGEISNNGYKRRTAWPSQALGFCCRKK